MLALGLSIAGAAFGAPFTPGNILVTTGNNAPIPNTVFEYTRTGTLVQSLAVPGIDGQSAPDYIRGVAIDRKGRLHVYNGTFKAALSTYDPVAGTWSHKVIPGLSVVNAGNLGRVAVYRDYVFLTDDETNQAEAMGIVRVNLTNNTWVRFATPSSYNDGYIDLNVGPDGLLYALAGEGSPSGRWIDVFDPVTLAKTKTIDLTPIAWGPAGSIGDIVVRSDGKIWANQMYSPSFLLNASGSIASTHTFTQNSYIDDFDMAQDGTLAQIQFDGKVHVYDPTFGFVRSFETSGYYYSQSQGAFIPALASLTVTAANPTAVPITLYAKDVYGGKDGTTAFIRTYKTGASVGMTAPPNVGGQYFAYWEKDGVKVTDARTLSVTMDADHTVRAVFLKAFNLTIGSENPTSGVPITAWVADEFGRTSGTTLFGRTYTQGTIAKFSAPLSVGDNYFMRWNLDGAPWVATPTISLAVSASRTLTAVYGTGVVLSVSSNAPSVPITVWTRDRIGRTNGTTAFQRLYAPNQTVSMTAPAAANGKAFVRWEKDGVPVPGSGKTVTLTMDAAHTASAVYAP